MLYRSGPKGSYHHIRYNIKIYETPKKQQIIKIYMFKPIQHAQNQEAKIKYSYFCKHKNSIIKLNCNYVVLLAKSERLHTLVVQMRATAFR